MKQTLFAIFVFLGLFSPRLANSQSFTLQRDTVNFAAINGGSILPSDLITNLKMATGLILKWHIDSTNFPLECLTASTFGVCDNNTCYYNSDDILWNPSASSQTTFTSKPYVYDLAGGFSLSLAWPNNVPSGSYYVTVTLTDPGSFYSKDATFIINNTATAVNSVPKSNDDILVYPNPAANELNVVYNSGADVKNVAIYNIIGKMMTIYKVSGNSANLNLDNIPSGIYLVRLLNSHGEPIVTRKFTKQ